GIRGQAGFFFLVLSLSVLTAAWAAPVGAVEPTVQGFAQALQQKYDQIKDFSTEFVHNYRGGVLNKQLSERGRLLIKKPGKMRWEYKSPDEKVFVSDGAKLYSYVPADKQVIVSSIPADDHASTPALFLAGKGDLLRDFTPSFTAVPSGMPAGSRALKLIPKTAEPDYDWLVLVVDSDTLALKGLVTTDAQGGTSTFFFTNLKENVALTDKEFDFKIPRGVDVVSDAPRR